MKKNFTFLLLLFLTFIEIKAQDRPVYNQIFLNPYFYNPAFAGTEMRPAIYLFRRQQWTGIEGAPVTNSLNFHTIFGKHALFGVNIYSDDRSLLNTTTVLISGGYRLVLDNEQYINFALSAGAGFNSIDLSAIDYTLLDDPDDPSLNAALENNIYMDGNAGISYHYNNFYFGVSLPRLFQTKYISSDQFDIGTFGPLNNLIAQTGVKIDISEKKFAFEPVLIYHYSKNTPNVFEAYGIFHFYDVFWLGAGYRQNTGYSGFVGLSIKDHFKFGYSYEVPTNFDNGNPSFSNGSHELQIALLIGKKKSTKPRQRNTYGKPRKEAEVTGSAFAYLDDIAESSDEEEVQDYTRNDTLQTGIIQKQSTPQKQKTTEVVKPQASPQKAPAPATKVQQKNKPRLSYTALGTMQTKKTKPVTKSKDQNKTSKKSRPVLADSMKIPVKKPPPVKPAIDDKGKYIGPKQVKKGNNLLELERGYYVVLGVFSGFEDAENYSDELFKRGFYTKYGYASQTKIYYVYSYHSTNFKSAKTESERLKRHNAKFRENWILTID